MTPPPDGPQRRPAPPSARPAAPRRDYAAEEAAAREIAAMNLLIRRGSFAEAEAAARAVLAARPGDAAAHEVVGDALAARGEAEAAKAAYRQSLAHEPGRASAESKFALLTLEGAEAGRRASLGVAYAAEDAALAARGGGGGRGLWAGLLGSALCPGLGQIVGGQAVKGLILVAVFLAGLGLLALLPKGTAGQSYFGPGFWLVTALLAADWVYAVADIALSSRQRD